MVQQVLADHGGAAPVKVDGGDVGGVVGDEEVAVYAGKDAQQHGTGDAQLVCQRQHGDHDGALGVDEHGNQEEHEGDAPGVVGDKVGEHQFHLVHVVAEVGVGQPGDAVNGDDGHHAGLPDRASHGFLGLCLAEHDIAGGRGEHDNLDADVHLREVDGFGQGVAAFNVDHLAECEADNHQEGAQEHEDGSLGFAGNLLVQGGGGVAVHVLVHFRVGLAFEEFGIVVQVLAAFVGGEGGAHEADDAGGDGDHQHLRDADHVAVGVGDGDKGHHGRGDGGAGDSHLGGDGSHAAGALRTDIFLEGDVADDGHDGVYHVSGADQDGEEEGDQGTQEGDVLRVLAEHLLRKLDHPVHAAGGLQGAGAGDSCDDDIDNVRGRRSGREAKAEHENSQADAGNGPEGQGPVAGAYVKGCQDDQQLHNHGEGHSRCFSFRRKYKK